MRFCEGGVGYFFIHVEWKASDPGLRRDDGLIIVVPDLIRDRWHPIRHCNRWIAAGLRPSQ